MSADLDEFRPPIIKTQPAAADECRRISDEGDCGDTPKTPEHKIPAMLTCPPAPRKPARRRVGATCKRKLRVSLKFFEIVARDEVESFFRMAEEEINGGPNKKRCVM